LAAMRGLGPKDIIESFIVIAFVVFLIKNKKNAAIGVSLYSDSRKTPFCPHINVSA